MNGYNPLFHSEKVTPSAIDELPAIEDATLPDPASDYDKAWGNARVKPTATLHCVLGSAGYESFTYAHLAANHKFRFGKQQEIILQFIDGKRWQVIIRGRNMLKLYDYILQCRMPWVRKADRDFETDKPIVTDIQIVELKEE